MSVIAQLGMEEAGRRTLCVLYRLSQGMSGIDVRLQDLLDEINRLGVMSMSMEEFEHFRAASVREFSKNPSVN